ncbi:hypothetical protein [Leuconostoc lactis]|uniref:hypothetical protein n=1 Tax=Leuconostoc lactis TaxID=1246 RepID=UPI001898ACA2|nr:hypothetical protein [Leuconostoc lactis]MDI6572751.1 hypothetical protein [Leuconostoc lactis]
MNNEQIEQLIKNLNYWQKINLMMSYYMTTSSFDREYCYGLALENVSKEDEVIYAFKKMINLGPTIGKDK